jgi:hypothetical protein
MKSTLILLGCIAYSAVAVSTSIKEKLGQAKKSNLAEQTCSCSLPGIASPGAGLPALSQAVYAGSSQGAQLSQGETLASSPDTLYSENCEQDVCACHQAVHSSHATATRIRTYAVNGTVNASESDLWAENGNASSSANG